MRTFSLVETGAMSFLFSSSNTYTHGYCQNKYYRNENACFHILSFHFVIVILYIPQFTYWLIKPQKASETDETKEWETLKPTRKKDFSNDPDHASQ